MNKPPHGTKIYWRFRKRIPCPYRSGTVRHLRDPDLVSIGADLPSAVVIDWNEIEWREYRT